MASPMRNAGLTDDAADHRASTELVDGAGRDCDPGDAGCCFDQRGNDRGGGGRLFTVWQPAVIDGLF